MKIGFELAEHYGIQLPKTDSLPEVDTIITEFNEDNTVGAKYERMVNYKTMADKIVFKNSDMLTFSMSRNARRTIWGRNQKQ